MRKLCTIFLLFLTMPIYGHIKIGFEDLICSDPEHCPYEDQEVKIRGFLYQMPEGQWLLAAQPNLRSCCVGSELKRDSQIFLEGNVALAETKSTILVKGTLYREPNEGQHIIYKMRNTVIEDENSSLPVGAMALCLLCVVVAGGAFLFQKLR